MFPQTYKWVSSICRKQRHDNSLCFPHIQECEGYPKLSEPVEENLTNYLKYQRTYLV
jgi:hypothetical protein